MKTAVLKIFITVAIFIHVKSVVGYLLSGMNYTRTDVLNKMIVDFELFGRRCCSLWPISHFVLYGIVTYMYPKEWKFIFLIGLVWEIYEWMLSRFFIKNTNVIKSDSNLQYNETWWAAEPLDIFMNTMGIALALLLKSRN